MSCKHGNWDPCDECNAEQESEESAYESGFAAGYAAAKRICVGQKTPAVRYRVERGWRVFRNLDIPHFCSDNGYTHGDRDQIFSLEIGQTVRVSKGRVVTATTEQEISNDSV